MEDLGFFWLSPLSAATRQLLFLRAPALILPDTMGLLNIAVNLIHPAGGGGVKTKLTSKTILYNVMSWEWHPFTSAILCWLGSRHKFSSHSEEGEFTNVWPSGLGNHRMTIRFVHPRPPSGPESLTSLSQAKYIDLVPRFPRVSCHDSICSKSKTISTSKSD